MRISIAHKIFLSCFLVSAVLIIVVTVAMQTSTGRGFAGYLSKASLDRMDWLPTRLEQLYGRTADWSALRDQPELWEQILREGSPRRAIPPPRPPRPPRDGSAGAGELRPPPLLRGEDRQTPHLALLDAQGLLVVGSPDALDRAARRVLFVQGKPIGELLLKSVDFPSDVERAFLADRARDAAWVAGLGLLVSMLPIYLLVRHFAKPIEAVARVSHRLAAGAYHERLPTNRSDEIGDMMRAVNGLAEALDHAEATRRRWMADTSHELRTPLAVLRAQIEAIQDGVHEANPRTMANLHAEVLRLEKLITDLHDLARADSSGMSLYCAVLDPLEVVREALMGFTPKLAAQALTLDDQCPEIATVRVSADANRLHQLLTNLLENSCRYTDKGGTIRLRQQVFADRWHLILEDSAPGVAPTDLASLFDRFFRAETSRSRARGGSGLGLSICRSIAEAHGGTLTAEASELGGLAMILSLPSLEPPLLETAL
jgi:two-component system, OmpR family, sensor histidine kinase BaeS